MFMTLVVVQTSQKHVFGPAAKIPRPRGNYTTLHIMSAATGNVVPGAGRHVRVHQPHARFETTTTDGGTTVVIVDFNVRTRNYRYDILLKPTNKYIEVIPPATRNSG